MENSSTPKKPGHHRSSSITAAPPPPSKSNFAVELFGPKDPAPPSSSVFGSLFQTPSAGLGTSSQFRRQDYGNQAGDAQYWKEDKKKGGSSSTSAGGNGSSKDKSGIYNCETVGPCHLSSSIYYGGQEVYTPPQTNEPRPLYFNTQEEGDDPNDISSHKASRGNWWKGSFNY
ncbi:uncharacterized protein LOC131166196 [Malania oleifera]|uniref:uncharacterized protein LOC131166196 n=1 Tax=Malania oleifera TaxID=397392 RepID=UPI0025AEB1D9|nr:uncharacterized protein LOC131166196 [Malania oleifera]